MEALHFTFATEAFVDSEEALAKNVNGFGGGALADWLSGELRKSGFAAGEVWPEDHGWDFSVAHAEARYLCACIIEKDEDGARGGSVIISKSRSMMDKLLGRNKFTINDEIAKAVHSALESNPEARGLVME